MIIYIKEFSKFMIILDIFKVFLKSNYEDSQAVALFNYERKVRSPGATVQYPAEVT